MVHLPHGVAGWTVFVTGLLIVASRVRGIDQPRQWLEWVERRFTAKRDLQFIGALLAVTGVAVAFLGTFEAGFVGWLYAASLALVVITGLALVLAQNHVRMLVVATAESEDKWIRISSGAFTLLGLLWALAPWFL